MLDNRATVARGFLKELFLRAGDVSPLQLRGANAGPITFSLWGAMLTLVLRRGHVNSRENMATAEYRRGHGTRHCEKVIGPGLMPTARRMSNPQKKRPPVMGGLFGIN